MMMMYENQTAVRATSTSTASASSPSSLPSTPKFVKKFQTNFGPLDLRKITLYGSQSLEESPKSCSSTSFSPSSTNNSSRETSPRNKKFASVSFHSNSHDSFMLKRQSSQNRLRESLLSSLLSPRSVFHVSIHFIHLALFAVIWFQLLNPPRLAIP
jgi:hypothetical protein